MIGLGALFLIGAAAVAWVFGHALGFGTFLSRWVPGLVPRLQAFVQSYGWTDAWAQAGAPLMSSPAWLPPALIGLVLFLFGWARRRS
ncbi:MAG TPA: hypothetical protein VGM87_06840 [Roseomonas sp.]|jgi:hypothetical protein